MLNMNRKKGISLTELVVTTVILAVVLLGAGGFSANFLDVSYIQSKQMQNINEMRTVSENIGNEIAKAAYIYPAGINLTLNGTSISTNSSVAMLFEDDSQYGFTAFYMQNGDLYQFVTSPGHYWDDNTSPASDMTEFSGSSSKIASDIDLDNTALTYILNYTNGITDEILEGEVSGITTNDPNALIRGVEWEISQDNVENRIIKIKELSRNVPRFSE